MPPLRVMVEEITTGLNDKNEEMRLYRMHQQQGRDDIAWCLTSADSLLRRGLEATAAFLRLTADSARRWALSQEAAFRLASARLGHVERSVFMLAAIVRFEQEVRDEDLVLAGQAFLTLANVDSMLDRLDDIQEAYHDIAERVRFCRQLYAEAPPLLFEPLQPLLEIMDVEYVTREQLEPGAECSICLEEYNEANDIDQAIVRLPCQGRHTFHADCITAWLDTRENEGEDISCPLDRDLLL